MAHSGLKYIVFTTLLALGAELFCRNGEAERANSQPAELFKALDGSECPHKWPDNA